MELRICPNIVLGKKTRKTIITGEKIASVTINRKLYLALEY